jgi:hypothetical protein
MWKMLKRKEVKNSSITERIRRAGRIQRRDDIRDERIN